MFRIKHVKLKMTHEKKEEFRSKQRHVIFKNIHLQSFYTQNSTTAHLDTHQDTVQILKKKNFRHCAKIEKKK